MPLSTCSPWMAPPTASCVVTFGAKDLFDVAVVLAVAAPTRPPRRLRRRPRRRRWPPCSTPAVGGRQTHTDEIAYSLMGSTPIMGLNSAAPAGCRGLLLRLGRRRRRRPGRFRAGQRHRRLGAAAGLVCRCWASAPAMGRLIWIWPAAGASFDTTGWFARDGAILRALGRPMA